MDTKQHVEAANALIQWFNSQEIAPSDAALIMSKVVAKILVGAVRGSHTPSQAREIDTGIDLFTLQLVHDVNDHLFAQRKSAGK